VPKIVKLRCEENLKERIDTMSDLKVAKERAEKIKDLLLALEKELRFFRDGSKAERDILRTELDFADVGYVSSLLTMLAEEDKFGRWCILSTYKFKSFRRRRI
jgi:hypothetical protein